MQCSLYSKLPKFCWKKSVIGIDFGSTGIRIVVVPVDDIKEFQIVQYDRCGPTVDPGDFPAYCCPFRRDYLRYVGENALELPDSQSIKYLMYHLGDVPDEGYPLSRRLRAEKTNPGFKKIATSIIQRSFEILRTNVENICVQHKLEYQEIALSVPGQWSQNMLNDYAAIIAGVFDTVPVNGIHWAHESEALFHYIMTHESSKLVPSIQQNPSMSGAQYLDAVLVLDFGGHSTDGCLYKLPWSGGQLIMQMEMDDYFYAPGGSELWKFLMGQAIAEDLLQRHGIKDDDNLHAREYLKRFFIELSLVQELRECMRRKARIRPPPKTFFQEKDGRVIPLELPWSVIYRCYDEAFEAPMRLAQQRIHQLATTKELVGLQKGVICSGGSIPRDSRGRMELEELCREYDCTLLFVEDMGTRWRSHNICRGAALSIIKSPSLKSFIQAGAAIGLQSTPETYTTNAAGRWCLWTEANGPEVVTLRATTRIELDLLCDPIYATRRDPKNNADWYDLKNLGTRPPGTYSFKLWLEKRQDGYWMVVEETARTRMKRRRGCAKAGMQESVSVAEFPLHRQSKDRSLQIDVDKIARSSSNEPLMDLDFNLESFLAEQTREEHVKPEAEAGPSRRRATGHTSRPRDDDETDDNDDVALLEGSPPIANVRSDVVRSDYYLRHKRMRADNNSPPSRTRVPISQLLSPVSPEADSPLHTFRSFASWRERW